MKYVFFIIDFIFFDSSFEDLCFPYPERGIKHVVEEALSYKTSQKIDSSSGLESRKGSINLFESTSLPIAYLNLYKVLSKQQ